MQFGIPCVGGNNQRDDPVDESKSSPASMNYVHGHEQIARRHDGGARQCLTAACYGAPAWLTVKAGDGPALPNETVT